LVLALLAQCGVAPERAGELLIRKRVGANKEAWFFTNPKGQDATGEVDVSGWTRAYDLLGGPIGAGANGRVSLTVPALDVRVLILEK
jgi:hypothetical protein